MGFFRGFGQSDNEPEHDEPSGAGDAGQTDSLARIEAGGIPLEAERRLKALGADGSLFTSGLSVTNSRCSARSGLGRCIAAGARAAVITASSRNPVPTSAPPTSGPRWCSS